MKSFDLLLQSAAAPPELIAAWEGAEVDRVDVLKSRAAWNIHMSCPQPLSAARVEATEQLLRGHFSFLQQLTIIPHIKDHDAWRAALAEDKEALWAWLEANSRSSRPLLERTQWRLKDHKLDIVTADPEVYEHLIATELCNHVAAWLEQRYRLLLIVRALLETESDLSRRAKPQFVSDRPVETLKAQEADQRNDYKLGMSGKEKVTPIADLQVGNSKKQNTVVIEGEVVERTANTMKSGQTTVTYDVTDYRDTISVISFMEPGVDDKIKTGDWIRVNGEVRFDDFRKDVLVVMKHYAKAQPPRREDKAERRRVELHAHTKMSDMDGLTEIDALVQRAADWQHAAIAITDHGCVQAFPQAAATAAKSGIKVIFGVEGYLVEQDINDHAWHIIILARNQVGLRNLYDLISLSYMDNFKRRPKLKKADILARREGLVLGTACESGELFRAVLRNAPEEELAAIIDFYDYLEIQPLCNNMFMVRNGDVKDEAELEAINRRIVALGRQYGKPVAATGDVHFLEPHDEIMRTIVLLGKKMADAEEPLPLYFRTTEEMLEQFTHLGAEDAYRAVVEAPNQIADMIEPLSPVPDKFCPPVIEGSAQEVEDMTWRAAYERYGDPLPEIVRERVTRELGSIIGHGYGVLYLVAQKVVAKSNKEGYMVGSRGSVGSSLVAFFTGITEVNALPPHYVCPQCRYSEFHGDGEIEAGADLPDKECPQCGALLQKDGFDIPFETFMGFEGDKVPDIDLNFSGDYQAQAHKFVEELFGSGNVFKAGTISTVGDKTAFGFVNGYAQDKGLALRRAERERLVRGIMGVKRTTGQHPGGMVVVPADVNVCEFTPIQHPAENKTSGIITTHFDYHSLEDQLVKLDMLGHDDPTVLKMLTDLTGIDARTVSLSDREVMKLFSGVDVLGLKPADIGSEVGTYGIPEFGTRFVRQMLEVTRPQTFGELVRISGLSHGTDVWQNNAHTLITQKIATLREAICIRDDIMAYLIHKGMDKSQAFAITEKVRKGKGLTAQEAQDMTDHAVPDWYIESCRRIKYMFPKAHAAAYVTMAFRIAWYKLNHPLAFYAAYFSVRADDFEAETALAGYQAIRRRIAELNARGREATAKEENLQTVLELALEMYARGFEFHPLDLYGSAATDFQIKDRGLLLPFSALSGVGAKAARQLVAARDEAPFLSVEDLRDRSHLNRTAIEKLRENNCFTNLPESNQLDLF